MTDSTALSALPPLKKNQQPPILLSICISTYNRQVLLAEVLDHLKWTLDTHLEIEIVISDNASEDETERVALEKGNMFPHFRYVRQARNIGAEKNAVAAMRLATGKFFVWLADDDQLIPDTLLAEVAYLNDHDDIAVSHAPWQICMDPYRLYTEENQMIRRDTPKVPFRSY